VGERAERANGRRRRDGRNLEVVGGEYRSTPDDGAEVVTGCPTRLRAAEHR
jgi:hypothetical protein